MPAQTSAARAALMAFLLVTIGSCIGGGIRFVLGVPLTVAGTLVACIAAHRMRQARSESRPDAICLLLSTMAAIGLAAPSPGGAFWYEILYRAHPIVGLVAIGVLAAGTPSQRRIAVWCAIATVVALAVLAPIAVPDPRIDVWHWIQTCGLALLHGVHPYTVRADDWTGGAWDFGSTPAVIPYMPLVIVAAAPWIAVLGDCRYGLALSVPIAIALLRAAGRRLRADAWMIDAVTLAWVLHPRATLVVIKSYQEPLLVVVLALFVYLAARDDDGYGAAISFCLLPAIKQYVAAPVMIYAAMRKRPMTIVAGAAVAAATVLPFLVWNARATVDGMLYLLRAPIGFRSDSDSLAALAAQMFDVRVGRALAVVAQFLAGAAAWWALRRQGLGGLLLASALSLLASFLLATQAFFNYYYFAGALLLCATLAAAAQPAGAMQETAVA